MKKKTEEIVYEVNKSSLIWSVFTAILFNFIYIYIFLQYNEVLKRLEEPILLFISLLFFIYISLPKVIHYTGEILLKIKYNKK